MPFGQVSLIIDLSVTRDFSGNTYHLMHDNIIIPAAGRMRISIYPVFQDRWKNNFSLPVLRVFAVKV
jgi:hypothetical protein